MSTIHQEVQRGAVLVWQKAKPDVIKLLAHLVIFICAALCVAIMLITTYGVITLCNLLFKSNEIYVKAACVIGEVIVSLYTIRFITHGRSGCVDELQQNGND